MNTTVVQKASIPMSWEFMNEGCWHEFMDQFPGNYDEEYGAEADFYEKVDEIVTLHYKNALQRLDDVLEKYPIHFTSISVDVMGMDDTAAFCLTPLPNKNKRNNTVSMGIGPGMVRAFLEKYWYPNAYISPFHELNFDHELIHGIDNNLKTYSTTLYSVESPKDIVLKYLLHYQTEGLASLVTFLRGISGEKSYQKASSKFNKNWSTLTMFAEPNPENWEMVSKTLKKHSYDFYELGPMMVLRAIEVQALNQNNTMRMQLVKKAINIEKLTQKEINELIIAGLELSLPQFVTGLITPSFNNAPFIKMEDLKFGLEYIFQWVNYQSSESLVTCQPVKTMAELESELQSIKHIGGEDSKKFELEFAMMELEEKSAYEVHRSNFYKQFISI